jgi:cation diffusion facilitator family transporter
VPPAERNAAIAAVVISVTLSAVKFFAWYLTDSSAVFSDALESLVNVVASGVALYAIALAHEPADDSHPYGHGKVEFLSATFEGGMMFAAAGAVAWHALAQWIHGHSIDSPESGALLLAATGVVNGVAGLMLVRLGKKRNSLALKADGQHLLADVVTTGAVLVALGLVYLTGLHWIDPVFALLASAYLVVTSVRLLRQSTAGLMDEQDADDDRLLRDLLNAHVTGATDPRICSYHKLRHRHNGRMHWIDFHVQVPPAMSVKESHELASSIEGEIEKALGEADATAHIEPCGEQGCKRCSGGNSAEC